MLSIQNLDICYGDTYAVRDLTVQVDKGQILALVGPTGCGKSSALRAVAGLLDPRSGEILIDGQKTTGDAFLPPENRETGMVFQDFALFPHLNVEANVGFRVKDPTQVDKWITKLGLDPFRKSMPETLSGGQKQRVALARSLAHQPKLLLLDEPLSNLDAALKIDLRAQIREAIKESGVTALWVTHDQDEAMATSDQIAVMSKGRLEQVDTPENCYEMPHSRFVAQFFGDGRFLKGVANGKGAQTALGTHLYIHANDASANASELEILIRPHDIALADSSETNATVISQHYEGETRRYQIQLDSGESVDARVAHERRFDTGSRVKAHIQSDHPLVAFSA